MALDSVTGGEIYVVETGSLLMFGAFLVVVGALLGFLIGNRRALVALIAIWIVASAAFVVLCDTPLPFSVLVWFVGVLAIPLVAGLAAAALGVALGRRRRPPTARSPSPATPGSPSP